MIFWMLVGHALADYPLQGDFLAQGKNRNTETGKSLWWMLLPMHAIIHGGAVALITKNVKLGIMESFSHAIIDVAKCENKITFAQDQALHIACKLLWAALIRGDR